MPTPMPLTESAWTKISLEPKIPGNATRVIIIKVHITVNIAFLPCEAAHSTLKFATLSIILFDTFFRII